MEDEIEELICDYDLSPIDGRLIAKELRATKRALWLMRAKNADLMSCKEFYNEYRREHPYSIWNDVRYGYSYATSFTNWSRTFINIERKCREKVKEFK